MCVPSDMTLALVTRAGSGAWNSGSMRTEPVKYSVGPLRGGCEPFRVISIVAAIVEDSDYEYQD
jgi:hypothetical protein